MRYSPDGQPLRLIPTRYSYLETPTRCHCGSRQSTVRSTQIRAGTIYRYRACGDCAANWVSRETVVQSFTATVMHLAVSCCSATAA